MFSKKYWSDNLKWDKEKRAIANMKPGKYKTKKLLEWRTWEKNNRIIINPSVFFDETSAEYTEENQIKERNLLEKEIGKSNATKLIEQAKHKWNKWIDTSNKYREQFKVEVEVDNKNALLTEEQRNKLAEDKYKEWTGYSVSMFSKKYWSDNLKWDKEKRAIAKMKPGKFKTKRLLEWRTWEKNNRIIINPSIFFDETSTEYTEENQIKERNLLEKEIGKSNTNKLIEQAKHKWNKWIDTSNKYREQFKVEVDVDNKNALLTEEQRNKLAEDKYKEWEKLNSPIEHLNIMKGSIVATEVLEGNGDSYLVYAPKRESDGNNT